MTVLTKLQVKEGDARKSKGGITQEQWIVNPRLSIVVDRRAAGLRTHVGTCFFALGGFSAQSL